MDSNQYIVNLVHATYFRDQFLLAVAFVLSYNSTPGIQYCRYHYYITYEIKTLPFEKPLDVFLTFCHLNLQSTIYTWVLCVCQIFQWIKIVLCYSYYVLNVILTT